MVNWLIPPLPPCPVPIKGLEMTLVIACPSEAPEVRQGETCFLFGNNLIRRHNTAGSAILTCEMEWRK